MKYRQKSIVIEAEQWFSVTYDREATHGFEPENNPIYHLDVDYYRNPDLAGKTKCSHCGMIMHVHGWIDTPEEGGHVVCPGDWIVTDTKGERYPWEPSIFNFTYELAEEGCNHLWEARNRCPGDSNSPAVAVCSKCGKRE